LATERRLRHADSREKEFEPADRKFAGTVFCFDFGCEFECQSVQMLGYIISCFLGLIQSPRVVRFVFAAGLFVYLCLQSRGFLIRLGFVALRPFKSVVGFSWHFGSKNWMLHI
jgi:hypothetical protein